MGGAGERRFAIPVADPREGTRSRAALGLSAARLAEFPQQPGRATLDAYPTSSLRLLVSRLALRPTWKACLPVPIPDWVPTVCWGCLPVGAQHIVGWPIERVQYGGVRQRRSHNFQVTSE